MARRARQLPRARSPEPAGLCSGSGAPGRCSPSFPERKKLVRDVTAPEPRSLSSPTPFPFSFSPHPGIRIQLPPSSVADYQKPKKTHHFSSFNPSVSSEPNCITPYSILLRLG